MTMTTNPYLHPTGIAVGRIGGAWQRGYDGLPRPPGAESTSAAMRAWREGKAAARRDERKSMLATLKWVRQEITRVNDAAGETVFNPAATDAISEEIRALGGHEWNPYTKKWQTERVNRYAEDKDNATE
jgi:hypothetical protein